MNEAKRFKEMEIEEFLNVLSSESPTPGGGTVSALCGVLSSSLLQMVCSITLKKSDSEELKNLKEKAGAWKNALSELMDLDSKAFDEVISAFSLPKGSEEEKEIRAKKIQAAFKNASEVPLKTAKTCNEILSELNKIKEKINPNVMSDWKVSNILAFAGTLGGISNVEINLSSIKDEDFKNTMNKELEKLKNSLKEALNEIKKEYSL
ncbi:MAG: cyclodeaminase/cyclohydrolase family protein [Candidatus Aminicenantia bacterium]